MTGTITIGPLTVTALADAEGAFFEPREDAFRSASAEQWADADAADPSARTADGGWWLRFRSFAVRYSGGPVTLVDAGIGPADALAASWAPVPGRLPDALAEAGIAPADVATIVLTHLHSDHIGWAVPADSPFTEARVVVQRADLTAFATAAQQDRLIAPLRAAGRLQEVDGDTDLSPGVRVVATPGHTPGHQSVLVGDEVLVTGDLLVHALQLVHPELTYGHDMDPEQARASRLRQFTPGRLLAVSHLGDAFVRTR